MIFSKILKKIVSILILFLILNCFNKDIISSDPGEDKEITDTIVSYKIYEDTLYPYKNYSNLDEKKSSIWEKEKANISHHQMIFDHFAKIIPFKFRKGISYFSIFYPENLGQINLGSIGRQKEDLLDFFSLNVSFDIWKQRNNIPVYTPSSLANTFGLDLVTYTLIHEFGHYIIDNKTQADLVFNEEKNFYHIKYKENSFYNQLSKLSQVKSSSSKEKSSNDNSDKLIEELFQKAEKGIISELEALEKIKKIKEELLPDDYYVSNYAKESPGEDAAETFTHFVLRKEKPIGNTIAEKKILLFYEDEEMIELRDAIRENLNLK